MGSVDRAGAWDFQIRRKLGEGSAGAVYEALCRRDRPEGIRAGQVVALKRIRKRAYLEREIRALTALSHPNIVRCYGAVEWSSEGWDEGVCLVCERLEGEDLAARLKRERRGLPWGEALRLLDAALDGLVHAEAKGIAHRDLKPSNLFLCTDGTVKWIDFGLARRAGGAGGLTVCAAEGWGGTLEYMAPEFARVDGFAGDLVSDIFSFGILACEVLTGAKPFEPLGEHPEIGFFRRWAGEMLPEPRWAEGFAYGLEGIGLFLKECLAADRGKRYQSFAQVRSAFGSLQPRVWKTATEEWQANGFLAEGGFSIVYRVRGVKTGREGALKRLHSGRHNWRFQKEAGLMERLQSFHHSAFPQLYEWWVEPEPEGRSCLVMEYLPGETLRDRLAAEPVGLSFEEVRTLFVRYLDGLAALHDAGLAHRDIKPSNLYAPAGRPEEARLLDLGIACERDGTLSMAGLPPGTWDYMAPEMVTQPLQRGSPQSDLFALGYVLYEALTGRPAMVRLPDEETAAVKALVLRSGGEGEFCAAFTGFDHLVFEERPELALIIGRAMRFDPKRRYGGGEESRWNGDGARAMRKELESLALEQGGGPEKAVEAHEPMPTRDPLEMRSSVPGLEPRPRRWRAWRAGSLLFLLVGIAGVAMWGWRLANAPRKMEPPVSAFSEPDRTESEAPGGDDRPEEAAISTDAAFLGTEQGLTDGTDSGRTLSTADRVVIHPKAPEASGRPVEEGINTSVRLGEEPEEKNESMGALAVYLSKEAEGSAVEVLKPDVGQWRREIEGAERVVEDWAGWLFRPTDPLRSLLPARFDRSAARPGAIHLPVLTGDERQALDPADRLLYDRLEVWRMAVDQGFLVGAAAAMRALARTATDLPELQRQLEEEAALLEWDGRNVPQELGNPGGPMVGIWRAYAWGAVGGEEEGRRVLAFLAERAQAGGILGPVEVALAVRMAENCWRLYVRNILERRPDEVVAIGTGRVRRDPVAAYRSAVERVRPAVEEEIEWLGRVAASGDGGVIKEWFTARVEGAKAGDWVLALPEIAETPLGIAAAVWRAKRGERRDAIERKVWEHIRGTVPLPTREEELPFRGG